MSSVVGDVVDVGRGLSVEVAALVREQRARVVAAERAELERRVVVSAARWQVVPSGRSFV